MAFPSETTSLKNPITYYKDQTTKYPSNSEVWWSYKRPTQIGSDDPPKTYLEVFDPALRHQVVRGNTKAPSGHYILDAFNLDRSAASGIAGLPVESAGGNRPTCVAFYAGRVFYAGVSSEKFSTKVYFSQILESEREISRCYQNGDPTSEEVYELTPADGGVLVIPEVAEVLYLKPVAQSLFVFATNGVWEISGSEGIGFRANDFSVSKVSGIGCVSVMSFTDVEGLPLWWNRSGIYTIAVTEQNAFYVQSLTDTSIKTFYQALPEESKAYAKGVYDPLNKIVKFLYRSTPPTQIEERFEYDSVLVLDVKTGGWYPWKVSGFDQVRLKGGVSLGGQQSVGGTHQVTVGGNNVVVGGDNVTVYVTETFQVEASIKYPVYVQGLGLTFADQLDERNRDWVDYNDVGFSYRSYFVSGYKLLGEGNKNFQSNYITVNYAPTEDGGAFFQGVWDFAVTSDTGRWSQRQQIYHPDAAYRYKNRKLKVRGSGEAIQVRVTNDGDKPFQINGWIVYVTGNAAP